MMFVVLTMETFTRTTCLRHCPTMLCPAFCTLQEAAFEAAIRLSLPQQQQDQQQPQYLQVWGYDYGQVPAPAMANVPLASPLALSGGGVPAPIVHPRLSVAPNPLAQPLAPQVSLQHAFFRCQFL